MSDGECIQRFIYDWFDRNYPKGLAWCDLAREGIFPALENRMIPAFDAVEYNVSNGGWAQFLWNCFGYWREIINVARDGYLLIGAPEQSAALNTLWALCERDERECDEMHKRAMAAKTPDGWSAVFAKFTSRSYAAPPDDWEPLFYWKDIHEKRLAWLAANEARVRKATGMLDEL